MTNFAVETRELKKIYQTIRRGATPALQGVTLGVETGTIFGLIGQNGSGKTTLVKILLGLSTVTSGSAILLGDRPGNAATRRRVGYLPEQMHLPDYFRAKDFLRYMGRLNGVDSSLINERIPQLLKTVGLGDLRKPVKSYSKGMQQRLGLAQALINEPELLFLDEPTDGLDPVGRRDMRELLVGLRARGKTIFLNSHLLSEVELICDQIVILDKGTVVRSATPAEFSRSKGEYLVRVARADDPVRQAVRSMIEPESETWKGTTLRFAPRDRAHLNAVLDCLRAVPVEIEAVEPLKLSLEQFFMEAVGQQEP
jgi:ABC-2 type transport system ATP-binding protein